MKKTATNIFLKKFRSEWLAGVAVLLLLLVFPGRLPAAERQRLTGHVPAVVAHLKSTGLLPGTNYLRLAIGLPLRNQPELTNLLAQIYNRKSTNYHRYLTPAQFAERFGPTSGDYQSLMAFAKANGLKITGTHSNRLLLDVGGQVSQIEQTFHVNLRSYPHPHEGRNFYAPDAEPSLDLTVPILHISGLDNYILPRPMNLRKSTRSSHSPGQPLAGSGPDGTYFGQDFRKAYVPGTVMTGLGQQVGLFQMQSGFYQSDITRYESLAGLPNVPITPVLLDDYNGSAGEANDECSLDIEMSISMAPGLSQVLVYEGVVADDILNQMATDDLAQQLSSSWLFVVDPTTDEIFQQFAGQGQSFFNAAGDYGAWVGGVAPPADDPNIISVGGTTLTTTTNGSWASETVWDWDSTNSTGGGISTDYYIPYWQQGIDMTLNQGSTTMRNIPDVALTADNIEVLYGDGTNDAFGGTSCAAPLWAGFTALINQQAADNYAGPVGFINPAIYALGEEANYPNVIHDITTGNNTNDQSDDLFFATPGYDLCTGWGTPAGQSLIDALVGPANPTPAYIITQPTNQTVVLGANVTFSVLAGGLPPFSYQWSFDGTNLVGATNDTLTLDNVQLGEAGDYEVLVTNAFGPVFSSTAVLTVDLAPPCATAPSGLVSWWPGEGNALDINGGNNGILEGGIAFTNGIVGQAFWYTSANADVRIPASASLDVGAGGSLTVEAWINCLNISQSMPIFEWNNDGASYGVHFYMFAGGSLYANVFDNGGGAHIFQTATGLITPNVFYHVALTYDYASGTGTIYCNGVVVAQESLGQFTPLTSYDLYLGRRPPTQGETYTFSGTLDEPSLYNRALSGDEILAIYSAGGTGKCQPMNPPVIITEPAGQTVGVGSNATFSVAATGYPALAYQWIFNDTNIIAGATNSILTLDNVQLSEAGLYSVTITNVLGSATSSDVVLTVNPPPPCTSAPSGLVSWWPGEGNALDINGGNNGVLEGGISFTNGIVGQAFWYTSANADVRIPASASLDVGAGGSLTVEAWINCLNISQSMPIFEWNNDGASYGVHFYMFAGGSLYANVFDNGGGAHIFQTTAGLITPNVFYHVALTYDYASGTGTIYCNGVVVAQESLGQFTPLTSYDLYLGRRPPTQGATYTFAGALDEPSLYNRALSGDEILAIYSAGGAGKCQPMNPPVIITEPADQTVDAGSNATFSVAATGYPALAYQWIFNDTNIITGATNSILTLDNVQLSEAGLYSVTITNVLGSATGSNAVLTVIGLPPTIGTQPVNRTVTAGLNITFSVTAGGTPPLSYQWKFQGTNLPNTINSSLALTNVQPSQAGVYAVLVTNAFGSLLSSNATLTVIALPPTIVTQPSNQVVYVGFPATFNVSASGNSPLSYQWKLQGTNLPGATNTLLILTSVQTNQAGNYTVLVTNAFGSALSSNALLMVNPILSCDSPPSGLVSWWPGQSNALDFVGTNNGILEGDITFTNGIVGEAFWYTNANADVRIPASASLNVGAGGGFTVEAWINCLNISQSMPIFEWNNNGASYGVHFYMFAGGSLYANVFDNRGGAHIFQTAAGLITSNVFYHVALTFNKATGVAAMYCNGALVIQSTVGTITPQTSYSLYLGRRPLTSGATYTFAGILDEPSLYNRALSATEIQGIYSVGMGGKCVPVPLVATQPTNQTVLAGSNATFSVSAGGSLPLAYQWLFAGTNIAGATNSSLTITNAQLINAGIYAVVITNSFGIALSSNALLQVHLQDHFAWSAIPSPRFVAMPFTATIQAQNVANGLVTNFTGTVDLTSTLGVPIQPPVSGAFVKGSWTGTVMVAQAATNLVLEANDGLGDLGLANAINIISPPLLGASVNGGSLLMYWPASPTGFVLETSTILNSSNWTQVPGSPALIGNQYFDSLQLSNTNHFFRLLLNGP